MIDREQVHKVALLARLELAPAEEEQFTIQLGSILEYFEQLSELMSVMQPTARALMSVCDAFRWLQPYSDVRAILNSAPIKRTTFSKYHKFSAPSNSPDCKL